jgi:2-polyprenyl-3-methyl-5-hydroxy-6-metoxy-1,4-benzoquinol methylase
MNSYFVKFFEMKGEQFAIEAACLVSKSFRIPINNGIPRFTPDLSYSTGNFSFLREKHATLQLDSVNGTKDRLQTILARTNWPAEFFKGKTVLECGCGAGPDTEILLGLGAMVLAVDIAGLDTAKKNITHPNVQFAQADITNLPFRRQAFDIVFCHRVLQHTPRPAETLEAILSLVKDDGAVFVHSYARRFVQMFRWKYFLRPVTTRLNPETLYNLIKWYSRPAFKLTSLLNRNIFTRYLTWVCIPFLNYRHQEAFKNKTDAFLLEFGIHDTFDALSPKYDNPLSASCIRGIAIRYLRSRFEVIETPTVTLLRTKIS